MAQPAQAESFASGRYVVRKFLGEGGKKKVYLAHDIVLGRDVAFALIKVEPDDELAIARVTREAQAMGRLGSHPHIVTVFDLGEHEGRPYMVTELMGGGDVDGLLEQTEGRRVPIEQAVEIAKGLPVGSISPTRGSLCTGTSSRGTSGWRKTASRRSVTSAWRSHSTALA